VKRKIVTVLGARPQFVKAAVVSRALARHTDLEEVVVDTGQHHDANMSEIFLLELGMARPRHQLGVHGGPHGQMTARMLERIEAVLLDERPDAVLVYGDTNSTLAGALAAAKLNIPVAHVEAGLRSFNRRMPEEVNRILTDRISRWLFAPTEAAVRHLQAEGVDPSTVFAVGDVMLDLALLQASRVDASGRQLGALGLAPKGYVLATVHRAENTDDAHRLRTIVQALCDLSSRCPVVWPLHPRTRDALTRSGGLQGMPADVRLIEPVGYLDMVQLEMHADVVVTDSGGVQKEAFFHRVPCVTLRDETEWTELVEAGWNRLVVPRDASRIVAEVQAASRRPGRDVHPYGRGDAALRIAQCLAADLGAGARRTATGET
jgi:UDP-GlcNAc3NAcA epimerase